MKHAVKKEKIINTTRVFTEGSQVYIHIGRKRKFQVPLRWIPVIIQE
ncbi:hypothetical protein [Croceitalea vernalis]|uniref:Uncharacterized protein n=1 Tax=Croceitalea vernalis TaxID=3075599 RepID=A0ABU3BH09_9FLAO|nr:hypothetical protein [Croceitalea sp. P007]MDT0621455.1 hypothetical protein [Croceitalea sp. P007]